MSNGRKFRRAAHERDYKQYVADTKAAAKAAAEAAAQASMERAKVRMTEMFARLGALGTAGNDIWELIVSEILEVNGHDVDDAEAVANLLTPRLLAITAVGRQEVWDALSILEDAPFVWPDGAEKDPSIVTDPVQRAVIEAWKLLDDSIAAVSSVVTGTDDE